MTIEELRKFLEYSLAEDIIRCKDENSKHNKKGEYGLNCDGKHLTINFEWEG